MCGKYFFLDLNDLRIAFLCDLMPTLAGLAGVFGELGACIKWGVPYNRWFIIENESINKWFRGTPNFRKPPIHDNWEMFMLGSALFLHPCLDKFQACCKLLINHLGNLAWHAVPNQSQSFVTWIQTDEQMQMTLWRQKSCTFVQLDQNLRGFP